MKIYATRQPKPDLDIFNEITGTDLWLKVGAPPFADRYLHIIRDVGNDRILVLNLPVYLFDTGYLYNRGAMGDIDGLIECLLKEPQEVSNSAYIVKYPLNYMTTSELFTELADYTTPAYTKYTAEDMIHMVEGAEASA